MNRVGLPPQLKEGCVLFIPGEVSGTTAYDASGNGNHGTLVNTPTPARGGLYGYKGLKFNGTSQYVTLPSINPSEFTVSITVAANQTSSLRGIVTKYYLDNVPLSSWWVDTTSNLFRFGIWGSGGDDVLTTTFNPTLGQNYRLTTVYSSGSMKIYVNGVLDNSKSTSIVPHTNSTNVLIGAFNGASPMFFGDMRAANLLIHNRALSSDEIRIDASTFFIP